MSTRGRKPKPTHLKLLEGNPGKRDLPKNEPKPRPIAPRCPQWLDPLARKEWRRVAKALNDLGLLTEVDGAALEGYCKAYSRWVTAEQEMDRAKITYFKTPSGYLQQLPQVSIAQKYLQIVKAFCSEFGLTPSARGRMSIPGQAEEDAFEEFLKNGSKKKT